MGREEDGALWETLICTREHTWLLRRLMRHLLNTSVHQAGGEGGAVGLRALGVNSSPQSHPSRPILLPADKCEIQAWWQPCRGETDAVASAQAELLLRAYRQPKLRPASVCHPWTLDRAGGKPASYCKLLLAKEVYMSSNSIRSIQGTVWFSVTYWQSWCRCDIPKLLFTMRAGATDCRRLSIRLKAKRIHF